MQGRQEGCGGDEEDEGERRRTELWRRGFELVEDERFRYSLEFVHRMEAVEEEGVVKLVYDEEQDVSALGVEELDGEVERGKEGEMVPGPVSLQIQEECSGKDWRVVVE